MTNCLSKRESERDLRSRLRRPGCARSSCRARASAVSGRSLPSVRVRGRVRVSVRVSVSVRVRVRVRVRARAWARV